MSEPATVASFKASLQTANDVGVPACVCGMRDLFPDKALLRRHMKNFYVVILKKTKQNRTKQNNKTTVLRSQICFKQLIICHVSQ